VNGPCPALRSAAAAPFLFRYEPKQHDFALAAELEGLVGTDGTVDSVPSVRIDTNVVRGKGLSCATSL
jgi:hypothetical protein